jgi:hypothetical protein
MGAKEIIKNAFAEFNQLEDEQLDFWIQLARPDVSSSKFGPQYEYAIALLACHKMKLNGLGKGLAGSKVTSADAHGLASVSEGETSISFDNSSINDLSAVSAELKKTVYGLQFLSLRARWIIPVTIS